MTGTPRLLDFNAPREPTATRLTKWFTGLLWLLVATPVAGFIVGLTADIIIAIAVSRPIRDGRGFWLELLVVTLVFGVLELIGSQVLRIMRSQWFAALSGGRPRFGPLKGPGKQIFKFILRCSGSIDMTLEPDIDSLIKRISARDALQLEQSYRYLYEKAGYDKAEWPNTWEQIQHAEFAGVQYGEAIRSGRWNMFWLRYYVVVRVVVPLSLIYTTGTFWLLVDVADGRSPLRLVQFALAVGVAIAFVIFINFTFSLRSVHLFNEEQSQALGLDKLAPSDPEFRNNMRQIKESTRDPELEHEIQSYSEKEFYPKVSIKSGYIAGIRNEFARQFLVFGCLNVATLILLLLLQWPIAHILSPWPGSQVDTWTVKMLVGSALIPIAFVAALMLGFTILSRFRKFAGVLATGLLLAVVPPLITYILRGSVGTTVLVSSIVTAAIGVLPSAIAELIRQKPGLENAS